MVPLLLHCLRYLASQVSSIFKRMAVRTTFKKAIRSFHLGTGSYPKASRARVLGQY